MGDAAQGPRVVAPVPLRAEAGALAEAAGRRAVGLRGALVADALPWLTGQRCCAAGRRQCHETQHCQHEGALEAHCRAARRQCPPVEQTSPRVISQSQGRGDWGHWFVAIEAEREHMSAG